MAPCIIILGPSQWKAQDDPRPPPMVVRRDIQVALAGSGQKAVLLEDYPGAGPPLQDKFERVLEAEGITDVVVYWPARAKTFTMQQELVILYGKHSSLRVWILHEALVLRRRMGRWMVGDSDRARYTNDLLAVAHAIHCWDGTAELQREVRFLAADLHHLQGKTSDP